ncbi:NTE family protein [Glaciihabitans tibetensis]|uniref:NTE family protein n=1 Tax=Glaciihabitans tibetensis TaxID=1266600 RepID=A0A2T0V6X7_9MICO|nr:patatin-like phospholipase family protein [Glaciihabitans tibetensis]PRY65901.1 NTE family protein [Glaciihabitans tibetensis]
MARGALVLAGGGSVGIAWELGYLAGLETSSPEVMDRIRDPDTTYVGTSAGSVVATMLASGIAAEQLLQPELDSETSASPGQQRSFWGIAKVATAMVSSRIGAKSPEEARRRIGAFAAKAATGPEDAWIASIGRRLPGRDWPERRLLITAVDVESGEFRVFDRDAGVDLASAVAASCAVPGIFPPVTIDGRRYMDGGMRSIANADLAAGCDPVLILVPMREGGPGIGSVSQGELDVFEHGRSHLVYADAESVRAFGRNPLSTTTRAASARAGLRQGRQAAGLVDQLSW